MNMTAKDRVLNAVNVGLLLCVLANFLVLAWAVARSRPKIERTESTVVSNHVFVITQVVERVSSGSTPDDKKRDVMGLEIAIPYHFYTENGARFARLFGRVFAEGSLSSYGRIEHIFPERIAIEDGVFIRNTFDPDEEDRERVKQRIQAPLKEDREQTIYNIEEGPDYDGRGVQSPRLIL